MPDSDSPFFNRELSWLEFNQRVLDEAFDESIPLLERMRFLAITTTNLDEFFMVRVGGLQTLAERGSTRRDPAGMTPEELALLEKEVAESRDSEKAEDAVEEPAEKPKPAAKKKQLPAGSLEAIPRRQRRSNSMPAAVK